MSATEDNDRQNRTTRAKDLRRDSSEPEKRMWYLLRAKRMQHLKFRRQHPIGPYFADFACPALKLVIEVDGDFHAFQRERDEERTRHLEQLGWCVMRFTAAEILNNADGVWTTLDDLLKRHHVPG